MPRSADPRGSEGTITAVSHPPITSRLTATLYFGKGEGEAKDIESDLDEMASSGGDPVLAAKSVGHVSNVAFSLSAFSPTARVHNGLVVVFRQYVQHCLQ